MGQLSLPDSAGNTKLVTLTGGAGNALYDFTVPTNTRWLLSTLNFEFLTDATAGSRFPRLKVVRSGVDIISIITKIAHTASLLLEHNFAHFGVDSTAIVAGTLQTSFPSPLSLRSGDLVRIQIIGGLVTDSIGTLALTADEWIEN